MKRLSMLLIALVFGLSFGLISSSYAAPKAAIYVYCPVFITKVMYGKGNSNFVTEYEGKAYYFAGLDQQRIFINDPETYTANLEKKYYHLKMKAEGAHEEEEEVTHEEEGSH